MEYDKTMHRWMLTIEDTKDVYESIQSEYGSETKAKQALKNQSRTVYAWIYNRIPNVNRNYVEYLIAKKEEVYNALKDALLAQLEYDIESGGNSVRNQIGIDFKSGNVIDHNAFPSYMVSPMVEMILSSLPPQYNILYVGNWRVALDENRYATYDY